MLTPRAIPVSAPPRVNERLRSAPDGPVPVLHRGDHALYVEVQGWCVGVLGTRAARVPCAVIARDEDFATLSGNSAHLADGVLHVDDRPLTLGRFRSVTVPRIQLPRPVREPLSSALDPAEVALLVGAGDGLTPYGDDVLCGWLAIHRAARVATPTIDEAVRSLLTHTTLLSATLLDCAMHGDVLPEFAAYVAALGSPDEDTMAAALTTIGHTSGAGLLYGARWGLGELQATIGVAA